jgi:hypothetical protein
MNYYIYCYINYYYLYYIYCYLYYYLTIIYLSYLSLFISPSIHLFSRCCAIVEATLVYTGCILLLPLLVLLCSLCASINYLVLSSAIYSSIYCIYYLSVLSIYYLLSSTVLTCCEAQDYTCFIPVFYIAFLDTQDSYPILSYLYICFLALL